LHGNGGFGIFDIIDGVYIASSHDKAVALIGLCHQTYQNNRYD